MHGAIILRTQACHKTSFGKSKLAMQPWFSLRAKYRRHVTVPLAALADSIVRFVSRRHSQLAFRGAWRRTKLRHRELKISLSKKRLLIFMPKASNMIIEKQLTIVKN